MIHRVARWLYCLYLRQRKSQHTNAIGSHNYPVFCGCQFFFFPQYYAHVSESKNIAGKHQILSPNGIVANCTYGHSTNIDRASTFIYSYSYRIQTYNLWQGFLSASSRFYTRLQAGGNYLLPIIFIQQYNANASYVTHMYIWTNTCIQSQWDIFLYYYYIYAIFIGAEIRQWSSILWCFGIVTKYTYTNYPYQLDGH